MTDYKIENTTNISLTDRQEELLEGLKVMGRSEAYTKPVSATLYVLINEEAVKQKEILELVKLGVVTENSDYNWGCSYYTVSELGSTIVSLIRKNRITLIWKIHNQTEYSWIKDIQPGDFIFTDEEDEAKIFYVEKDASDIVDFLNGTDIDGSYSLVSEEKRG